MACIAAGIDSPLDLSISTDALDLICDENGQQLVRIFVDHPRPLPREAFPLLRRKLVEVCEEPHWRLCHAWFVVAAVFCLERQITKDETWPRDLPCFLECMNRVHTLAYDRVEIDSMQAGILKATKRVKEAHENSPRRPATSEFGVERMGALAEQIVMERERVAEARKDLDNAKKELDAALKDVGTLRREKGRD